ncbi:MAG: hypothetical protein V4543_14920 [Bacteroidota bacterium]
MPIKFKQHPHQQQREERKESPEELFLRLRIRSAVSNAATEYFNCHLSFANTEQLSKTTGYSPSEIENSIGDLQSRISSDNFRALTANVIQSVYLNATIGKSAQAAKLWMQIVESWSPLPAHIPPPVPDNITIKFGAGMEYMNKLNHNNEYNENPATGADYNSDVDSNTAFGACSSNSDTLASVSTEQVELASATQSSDNATNTGNSTFIPEKELVPGIGIQTSFSENKNNAAASAQTGNTQVADTGHFPVQATPAFGNGGISDPVNNPVSTHSAQNAASHAAESSRSEPSVTENSVYHGKAPRKHMSVYNFNKGNRRFRRYG